MARAGCREAAEARLSLSCAPLSKREALSSKVRRSTCKSWNVQYTGNKKTWNSVRGNGVSPALVTEDGRAFRQSWTRTLEWPKQEAQAGKGVARSSPTLIIFCVVIKMPWFGIHIAAVENEGGVGGVWEPFCILICPSWHSFCQSN